MARSRVVDIVVIGTCLLLAAFLRVSNYSFVFADVTGHLNFIDTDCYYYLRRILHFIANFPHIMVFDPLMDWPAGGAVDWPEGFLLIVGVPLKILGVESFRSLEIGACSIVILLGLFNCLVIFKAAQAVLNRLDLRTLACVFASINFLLIRFSCLGQVDHHILEAMFPGLFFLGALSAVENNSWRRAFLLGCLVTFSLSISSSSLFSILALFVGYGFALASAKSQRIYFVFLLGIFVTLVPYAIWSGLRRGDFFATNYPSFFQCLLLMVMATVAWLIGHWRSHKKIAVGVIVCFVVGLIALSSMEYFIILLKGSLDYVFGHTGILGNVFEARPLFLGFSGVELGYMHVNFGYLIYLLPLVWGMIFFKNKLSMAERLLVFMLSVEAIPAVYQKRFAHLMVGLFILFVVWVLGRILNLFESRSIRFQLPLIALFMGAQILPILDGGLAPRQSPRDIVDLGISRQFLESIHVDQREGWNRLAGKAVTAEGVWANTNLGHMLLYYSGLGVVSNSFYHPKGFDLDFKLRKIESDKEFTAELKKNKLGYIIPVDDWNMFELLYQLHGEPNSHFYVTANINGEPQRAWNTPYFMRFAWARLILTNIVNPDLESLFSRRTKENHFYNFARGFRVN